MLLRNLNYIHKMAYCSQYTSFVKSSKKIIGAGINYNEYLKLNPAVAKPQNPILFMKPSTSYIEEGQCIQIPEGFTINEEVELGVVIGKNGKNISENDAMDYVAGYCLALDLTDVGFLSVARQKGMPWLVGKGFDSSCPVSRFISKKEIPDPSNVNLWLKINGKKIQEGNTSDLIFNVQKLISYISKFMTLEENDLILTGTPPNMTPIKSGDKIEAGIKDLITIKFDVK